MSMFSWLSAWLGPVREKRLDAINAPVTPPPPVPKPAALSPTPIEPKRPTSSRYEQAADYLSSGSKARVIDLCVIHCTGRGLFSGAIAWLTAKDTTPVSAHYGISKSGELVQMVGENDVAYHAGGTKEKPSSWRGRGNINARSIGIELENRDDGVDPYTPIQLSVLLWLCLRICRRNGLTVEQFIGHEDVDPGRKTDPRAFPWADFRTSFAVHLLRSGENA